jgi:ribonuclease P protein subunit POP4
MDRIQFPHELIGKKVTIIEATDPNLIGVSGEIVEETKSSITIGNKMLLKNAITLKIEQSGEIVSGKDIVKKPEDRIKGKR